VELARFILFIAALNALTFEAALPGRGPVIVAAFFSGDEFSTVRKVL
jgi:hypothetical protein